MFEVLQVGHRGGRQGGEIGGVELGAGDGEDTIAVIDQRGQGDGGPDGFEAECVGSHELNARLLGGDDFLAVDDLALAFGFEQGEDVFGVARLRGVELVGVEQFQGVQDGGGLLGAVGLGDAAQRFLGGLLGVPVAAVGDQGGELRVFRGAIDEMLGEAFRGHGIDGVPDVEGATDAGAFQALDEFSAGALVGDFHGLEQVLLQPLGQDGEMFDGLLLVGLLFDARGDGAKLQRGGVELEAEGEGFVLAGEAEEDFVGLFLVGVARRVKGLDEVEVELALGDGGGAVVGRAKEEVTEAASFAVQPFDFVLPDLEAGDVGGDVGTFQDLAERVVVVAVKGAAVEGLGALLNERVVVVGFLEVEEKLAVVLVGRDELAADGLVGFAERGFDDREEIIGGVAAHFRGARVVEAETIAELLRRETERGVQVARGEAVNGEALDDADGQGLVGLFRKGALDLGFKGGAAFDDGFDFGQGAVGRVFLERLPIAVEGDDAGAVLGHFLGDQFLDGK